MPVFRHDKKRWQHESPAEGIPTIFDPATYYGDRECDLAMTEIFGGYPASLYNAYYVTRHDLYNLYHILKSRQFVWRGYANQAVLLLNRLLIKTN